jgi:antitoxin component of RelBE/YafQ-DinJ toxin-antitoxin module
MKSKKTAKIEFKLEEELFQNYKSLCDRQGFDMSKRIRLFLEKEIEFDKRGENIIQKLN